MSARDAAPGQADPWQVITDVTSALLLGGQTASIRCTAALRVLDAAGIDFSGNPVKGAVTAAAAAQGAPYDPAVCKCGHWQAHHAFSEDVCAVVDCPCMKYSGTEREAAAQGASGDYELREMLAAVATQRNQYRIALERIADGSRNRDGMMGCAQRALDEQPAPAAAPEPLTVSPGDGTPIGGLLGHVMGTGQEPAAAPEVAGLRELLAEILSHFGPSGSGHTARVGQVQIAKWRKRAGIEET